MHFCHNLHSDFLTTYISNFQPYTFNADYPIYFPDNDAMTIDARFSLRDGDALFALHDGGEGYYKLYFTFLTGSGLQAHSGYVKL